MNLDLETGSFWEVVVRFLFLTVTFAILVALPCRVGAEDDTRSNVELGVLTGITIFVADENVDFTAHVPSGSAGIYAPITPSLRLSFWSETPFIFDLGTSIFSSNVFGNSFSALNFEIGIGVRTMAPSKVVPSASLLLGFVHWSAETDTNDSYVGGQAGVRVFMNNRTSFRTQLGYRHTLQGPSDGFDIDSVEIGIGLGVFL